VIVDEAQDLHETQWRMLRAAAAEEPNDLFIVGDSHQRIYDRRSSLSKVGINIRGRSHKLRINYRTTHEILRWSLQLLGTHSYDDLDEGAESHDFAGYHSFMHGPEPTLHGAVSRRAEIDALVGQVKQWNADGVDEEDIAVTARRGDDLDSVEKRLEAEGIQTCRLGRSVPTSEGVRLGTMHRVKGLEFRCVAITGADDERIPEPRALTDKTADEVQHRLDLQREGCLLYVAATRAREDLWIGWSGRPSRYLGAVESG
jgi:superfamily I DNA/RNA helicase